jgi:hypothetical protein
MICGVIMLVGGPIGMALMRLKREAMQAMQAMRWASEMPEEAVGSA